MKVDRQTWEKSARFEHQFWLQVLGDHARFFLDTLASKETKEIDAAKRYKEGFDGLLQQARGNADLTKLTAAAEEMATSIRDFKLHMIRRHLTGKISIHLSPTFLNHMVNEVEEYLGILKYLKTEQMPPLYHELHYHMVWLPDAAGHAGAISDTMDAVEKDIKARSKEYSVHFEQFYIKAVELAGYLRTNLKEFPALKRMNQEVKMEIMLFRKFLKEIEELELSHEVLGTFSALMADHMAREECYYLTKVAMASQTTEPGCNPAKPRVEEN
jgi:hypothetical protein